MAVTDNGIIRQVDRQSVIFNAFCFVLHWFFRFYRIVPSQDRTDPCDHLFGIEGFHDADQNIFEEIVSSTGAGKNRHPLTYILEAADDLAYKTADIEDAFVKGFISYHDLEKELEGLQSSFTDLSFDALGKLRTLYERGKEKQADNPEAYAVKNWIVRVQGFLISCATSGFTSNNYE